MANNINREGFKRFLELGAPSFEGNIILDSGELSEYYYRFMRIPLAYGEHMLEESGCYESEVEMMKTARTYDVFVRKVHDAIDWGYLCTQMTELENNTIAAAIDKVHGMTTKTEDDA